MVGGGIITIMVNIDKKIKLRTLPLCLFYPIHKKVLSFFRKGSPTNSPK